MRNEFSRGQSIVNSLKKNMNNAGGNEKDLRNKKLIRAKMNYYSLPEGWVLWNSPLSIVLVNINWRFPPRFELFSYLSRFSSTFSFFDSIGFDNTWKKKMQSVNYGTNRGWNCCASKTNVETGREKEKETALPSVEFYSLCWHDMRQTCLHVYIYISCIKPRFINLEMDEVEFKKIFFNAVKYLISTFYNFFFFILYN